MRFITLCLSLVFLCGLAHGQDYNTRVVKCGELTDMHNSNKLQFIKTFEGSPIIIYGKVKKVDIHLQSDFAVIQLYGHEYLSTCDIIPLDDGLDSEFAHTLKPEQHVVIFCDEIRHDVFDLEAFSCALLEGNDQHSVGFFSIYTNSAKGGSDHRYALELVLKVYLPEEMRRAIFPTEFE